MEPLLRLDGLQSRVRNLSSTKCFLLFTVAMQILNLILLLLIVFNIAPIVPDIMKVLRLVDTTLSDVTIMLPEMNGTIWDLNNVLPGIKQTIYYTEAICKHTSGCLGYK